MALWAVAVSRQDGSPSDGIHLLWAAPAAAGYSLTGYDIQRRESQPQRRPMCYDLTPADLTALHTDLHLATPVADVSVRATPCPVPTAAVPDEPFRAEPAAQIHCVEIADVDVETADALDGARLTAFDSGGVRLPHVMVRTIGSARGVDCASHLEIALPATAGEVQLRLVGFASPSRLVARDAAGTVVASASTSAPSGQAQTLTLRAAQITRVGIVSPSGATLATRLCWTPASTPLPVPPAETSALRAAAILPGASIPSCLCYRLRLNGEHQLVRIDAQVPAILAVALREGKAVDARSLADAGGFQRMTFAGRGVDQVLLYSGLRISNLRICVDPLSTSADEDAEWANVPFIVKNLQMPLRGLDPTLTNADDELARATSRLVPSESIDPTAFAAFAATMNDALGAGPASPMCFTAKTRERAQDPFVEVRPWPYALSLSAMAEWRRALGLGYLDDGSALVSGTHYDYRVVGRFARRDIEETLLAFHTVPAGTTLPATFQLDTVRLSTTVPSVVEQFPPVAELALTGTGRKGIRIAGGLTLGFDAPVTRVVLEMEQAVGAAVHYSAKTSDFLIGLSGTTFTGTLTVAPRTTIDFAEPIDTLEVDGDVQLYGVRILAPHPGNPDDVLDVSAVLAGVVYEPTPPPQPPLTLGTTNLQQPILTGDPAVTTQNPPQSLGFRLRLLPPPPTSGSPPSWPPDLGAAPPFDVLGFRLERRRVDSDGPFEEIGGQSLPTVFFGNRGSRGEPVPLDFGADLLTIFPEFETPQPPVEPWIAVDDVLRNAARPDGPPPGSLFQYRVFSVDPIGRLSATPTAGSIVRLEKRIPPPQPPGPGDGPPAGVVRPSGVRARVLQSSDPELATADIAILGSSNNAIVLEWGWTDAERQRDPFATEFRVYWQSTPPDMLHGELHGTASMVDGLYEMACTLDQPVAAEVLRGSYITAGAYPFKVASHTTGTSITVRFEPSLLQPGTLPSATAFQFAPPLDGTELRPAAWQERAAVVPIEPAAPKPFVLRDRLTLDALHPRARVWVGVSSADAQSYVPDERSSATLNGGRPGNESSVVAVVAEARYLGRPTFVVPPPLPDVPEEVSPEPVGATVNIPMDLAALLPTVPIPPGHLVVVDRLDVGTLIAALSRNTDGTIGVLLPDGSTTSYSLGNPADQAALLGEIAGGEAARIENRFVMDLLLRFPDPFEPLWQRALPAPVSFGPVTETLPSKADRWLHRIRLVDPAGHVSQGAAIVERVVRVASTRAPNPPELTMQNSDTDALSLSARMRQASDLRWLVLFTLVAPDSDPVDPRLRHKAQLLRIPDRRDLYPKHGLRVRLADGTLLEPADAVDITTVGRVEVPDVLVPTVITPGHARRVSVWALTMTRDGIPSRLAGPLTARTGAAPLLIPGLMVSASNGTDRATWGPPGGTVEVALQRSTDTGVTWRQVSPWLPATSGGYALPAVGGRRYRLVVRGASLQQTAAGPATEVT